MTTQNNIRFFWGAAILTLVLIAGLCGFIAVGLSMDRYMPGEFSPIFLVTDIGPEGIGVCLMGNEYRLEPAGAGQIGEQAWKFRGFLPRSLRIAGGIAQSVIENLESGMDDKR